MDAIYILIIYLVFLFFLFAVNYYANLISTKDQYTKEELLKVFPYLEESRKKLSDKYPFPKYLIILGAASLFGMLFPLLSSGMFFNSAILFIVLYLLTPIMTEHIESTKVNSSSEPMDEIANHFSAYAGIILLGFGAGTGTSLMYNWAQKKELGFLWFMFNLIIIVVLGVMTINKELKEE